MISSDVIHQSVWRVLGVHDTKISVDTVVCIWASHSLLKKLNELLVVAEFLEVLDEIFKVIWMNDDLETTEGGRLEFLGSDAGEADSFPDFWNIGFLGGFVSGNVILEHDMNLSEFLVVSNSCEKNLCCLEELVFEASFSDFKEVSLVWI